MFCSINYLFWQKQFLFFFFFSENKLITHLKYIFVQFFVFISDLQRITDKHLYPRNEKKFNVKHQNDMVFIYVIAFYGLYFQIVAQNSSCLLRAYLSHLFRNVFN